MENTQSIAVDYPDIIGNLLTLGVVMVDRRFTVVLWNRFMELNSHVRADEVLGKDIFDAFPELNRNWLEKKIKSCMILKTPSFSSWRQRPYLFRFKASPTLAGDAEFMYQDISIFPIRNSDGVVQGACIAIHDATELAESTRLLEQALDQAVDLEESSQRDGLTGLYNRKFFDEQITQEILRARRYGWLLALAMIDVDHFKPINDRHGHPAGDAVLRILAGKLQSMLRTSDTLCRYGGEEFALILPHISLENSRFLLERLRRAIEGLEVELEDGSIIRVTVSVGIAQLDEGMMAGEMVRRADATLYACKRAGRNRVACWGDAPAGPAADA